MQEFHAGLKGFGHVGPENYSKEAKTPILRVSPRRVATGGPHRKPEFEPWRQSRVGHGARRKVVVVGRPRRRCFPARNRALWLSPGRYWGFQAPLAQPATLAASAPREAI
jgi:hypothetical protein